MKAQEIMKKLLEDGGFTYSPSSKMFCTTGYACGTGHENEVVIASTAITTSLIEEYIASKRDILSQNPSACVGGWVYEGNIFLDISLVFASNELAEAQCRQIGDIAYFDLVNGTEIFVNKDRKII